MKKILVVGLVLSLIVILSGCISSGPENNIIGKWEDSEVYIKSSGELGTLKFFEDGTLVATYFYERPTTLTGEYKFVDDNHILLDFGSSDSYVCEFSLSEDKLILTYPGKYRGVRTYHRVE